MQQKESKVPHERYPRRPKKTPAIAQGRLQADIKMTTEEIEYHTKYPHHDKEQQERIISRRIKHLKKIKEKMSK